VYTYICIHIETLQPSEQEFKNKPQTRPTGRHGGVRACVKTGETVQSAERDLKPQTRPTYQCIGVLVSFATFWCVRLFCESLWQLKAIRKRDLHIKYTYIYISINIHIYVYIYIYIHIYRLFYVQIFFANSFLLSERSLKPQKRPIYQCIGLLCDFLMCGSLLRRDTSIVRARP